jgi:hypothetical protein
MMRGIARSAVGIVVVLAVAWGGLWWYVEGRLHDMLAASASMQNTSDGSSVISYDGISRGTNPLTASATLHNLHWSLLAPGEDTPSVIEAAQVTAWIDAFNPLVMHIGLPNRVDVATPRAGGSVTFETIAINAGLNPRALWDRNIYALTGQNLAIQNMNVLAGGGNFPLLHVDNIAGQETFNPGAGPSQTALAGQYSLDGVALSPLFVALGHVPFGGKITHLGFSVMLSGAADWTGLMDQLRSQDLSERDRGELVLHATHDWAAQGGNGKANLTLTLGPSTLNAAGAVAFDAKAQPSGTADVTADHLDALTSALINAYPQLQQSIVTLEAQLSPYLTTTDVGGQVLNVHIAYGKPGVLVNGERKADMPPIDWAALENPPAPVPQAPGDGSGAASTAP